VTRQAGAGSKDAKNELQRRTSKLADQRKAKKSGGTAAEDRNATRFSPDFAANLASGLKKMSIGSRRTPEGPRVPDLATAAGPALAHLAGKAKRGSTGDKERDERIKRALRARGWVPALFFHDTRSWFGLCLSISV
jgi:hypothetical protein